MTAEKIPLHDLLEITNGFSVCSRIGQGEYGDVYRGAYHGKEVAVKLLRVDMVQGIDDQQYINEISHFSRVKHPNVVELLGYSSETRSELVKHKDKQCYVKHIDRALCFEYLHGSLDKRLPEKSFAPDWSARYKIIKGICEGLNFLHRCEPPIFHLDLKPANILLDSFKVPKLVDFGLARVTNGWHTHVTRYMSPEFINDGIISHKNDVFSFGVVMIYIMTGTSDYSDHTEIFGVPQYGKKVHTDWKNRIEATSDCPSEELHQVQTCIDTAMCCVEPDRNNRPTIAEVLDILNKTETHIPKRQLKTMQDELDNITNKIFNCMPKDSVNINAQQVPNRETSDVEQTLILGRTEEKHNIWSMIEATSTY
ncbi:G-type lectin S-receptor-like serine/threonine-protein kinase SD1-13 isoform X1 [Triticum dicoccoides]|uniref:G-type lectin S-receptor-like serine/threonine-protein kinase SD1-13 isoform X1 n=1 Tax=Triticum dicoccoides TaxID=85692 RepID=UPI000E7A7104|nr:G-type lectin S-receptor-like serine/threonine-protein kinase SD1-13 isoform X1 [Triticum dicoccoides]XP_037438966.1 G-type lectin S-receptor-like serine/threonine-protein kinase SD1-13 isoform X1 [Triticum dicoccoides]